MIESTLVLAPMTTLNRHQPVIGTLRFLHDLMTLPEHRPEMRLHCRAVAVVSHTFDVGGARVEFLFHISWSELAEGACFDTEEFERGVEIPDICAPELGEEVGCEGGAAVRGCYCR